MEIVSVGAIGKRTYVAAFGGLRPFSFFVPASEVEPNLPPGLGMRCCRGCCCSSPARHARPRR